MDKLVKKLYLLDLISKIIYVSVLSLFLILLIVRTILDHFFDTTVLNYISYSSPFPLLLLIFVIFNFITKNISNKINIESTKNSQHSYGKVYDTSWTKKYIDRNKVVKRRFIFIFAPILAVSISVLIPTAILRNYYPSEEIIYDLLNTLFVFSIIGTAVCGIFFFVFFSCDTKPRLVEINGHLFFIYEVLGIYNIFLDDKKVATTNWQKKEIFLEDQTRVVFLSGALYKSSDVNLTK